MDKEVLDKIEEAVGEDFSDGVYSVGELYEKAEAGDMPNSQNVRDIVLAFMYSMSLQDLYGMVATIEEVRGTDG